MKPTIWPHYGYNGFVGGGNCLCCGHEVTRLIDFGKTPLANTYNVTEKFPLKVNRCTECYHLQLHEFVDPKILYKDYAYRSNTGRTALDYFKDFARLAKSYFPEAISVLDIACNDSSQLDAFKKLGFSTHGVDPAENLALISKPKGHEIYVGFFPTVRFKREFDIIVAQNVVGHTNNPLEFLIGCAEIMHDESKLFITTSQANMIVNGECDTIYHEHISYFNSLSMRTLAARAGLRVIDIVMQDIHGTSFLFVLSKTGIGTDRMHDRTAWESYVGMYSPTLYYWWVGHVHNKIRRIKAAIDEYVKDGFYTVGCGAAAKGISLLNMADTKLDLLVDTTPSKWGKIASVMPIMPFDHVSEISASKVLFVILPWNLRHEVKRNVLALRDNPNDVFIEIR